MKVDPTSGPQFFDRDAKRVARELIGCYLVCRRNSNLLKHKITETEAYAGPHDLACHSSKGRTKRTEAMFGPPGTLLGPHVRARAQDVRKLTFWHAHLDEFWRDSDPIHHLRENLKSCHQPSSQISLGVGQHERVVEAKSDLAAVDPRSAH